MQADYDNALIDPNLLSSRREIALLKVRIEQQTGQLRGDESGSCLVAVRDAWADVQLTFRAE